jgi:hypothetical protein
LTIPQLWEKYHTIAKTKVRALEKEEGFLIVQGSMSKGLIVYHRYPKDQIKDAEAIISP